jgi:membrane-associated phospholipid phosphatase
MLNRIAIFLLICVTSFNSVAQNPDINILKEVSEDRNRAWDKEIENTSNSIRYLGAGVPLVMISIGFIKKDSTLKIKGLEIAAAQILNGVLTYSLKHAVNRDRPYVTYPYLYYDGPAGGPSFPSGHTSSAFALATSLSLNFRKWYIIVPSYLYASGIGYSRMYLGVHYPSDVLAGALIGTGSAILCYEANKWLHKKRNK